jgi:hypothetical protein
MNALAKTCIVVLGYVAAWLIADQALALHQWLTAADSRGADGMYAFGDSLFFIAAFCLVALVPTGAAIYFLRQSQALGPGLSALALGMAATAPAAAVVPFAVHHADPASLLNLLSPFAILRLFLAPLLCLASLAAGLLLRGSPSGRKLLVASGIEAAASVYFVLFMYVVRP